MPRVANPGLGPGQSAFNTTTTVLTAAQISTLFSSPVQLAPAPGANKIYAVLGIHIVFKPGTALFQSAAADQLAVYYANSTQDIIPASSLTGMITAATWYYAYSASAALGPYVAVPGADNQAIVLSAPNDYAVGSILTMTVANGGAGYSLASGGTVNSGNGDGGYTVHTVGGGGVVTSVVPSGSPDGTGYSVANGVTTTNVVGPGNGALTVNITAIQIGNGTLKAILDYVIIANTVP